MERILLFIFLFCISALSFAQEGAIKCGAHELMLQEVSKNSELAIKKAHFEEELRKYLNSPQKRSLDSTVRIIPVVVHVFHQGGSENISKAQIENQIEILNQDFRRLNADTTSTPAGFDSVAADLKVEFRLATIDPLGNCTEGINRIYTMKTYNASNATGFKALSYWNSDQYLNIWVVNNITMDNQYGTVIGYAQFPESGLMSTDGIVVAHNQMGDIGTAANDYNGRTTTHEVGHWLGLKHVWGDSECGSDGVEDTPLAEDANFNCPAYPKLSTCDGADPVNGEMFMNYMDYTDGDCQNMFTLGQKEIIDFTLAASRSNLWSEQNLIATGVANGTSLPDCAPIAHFTFDNNWICAGENIVFYDESYNGDIDSRAWTFQGGTPGTSSATNPSVTYSSSGFYDVSLSVTNSNGTHTVTEVGTIYVSNTWAYDTDGDYHENFENDSHYWNHWKIINNDNSENAWNLYEGVVDQGNQCVRMQNVENTIYEEDWLISPSYNMSHMSNVSINFMYAGASRTAEPGDEVKVYVTTNCGETWVPRGSGVVGTTLANNGLHLEEFIPNSNTVWDNYSVTIPATYLHGNFRYALVFTSGGSGNHVYIDDVKVTGSNVQLIENELNSITVFPNPVKNDIINLSFYTPNPGVCSITLINVLGKECITFIEEKANSGVNIFQISVDNYPRGIYLLKVSTLESTLVEKLIIQ